MPPASPARARFAAALGTSRLAYIAAHPQRSVFSQVSCIPGNPCKHLHHIAAHRRLRLRPAAPVRCVLERRRVGRRAGAAVESSAAFQKHASRAKDTRPLTSRLHTCAAATLDNVPSAERRLTRLAAERAPAASALSSHRRSRVAWHVIRRQIMGGASSHSPKKKKSPSPSTARKPSPSLPGRHRRFKKPDDQPTDTEGALNDPAAIDEAEEAAENTAENAAENAAEVVNQEVAIDVVEPVPGGVDEREVVAGEEVAGEEVAAAVAKELAEAEEEEEVAEAIAKIVASILEKAVAEATMAVEAEATKASKVRHVHPNLHGSPNIQPSPQREPKP